MTTDFVFVCVDYTFDVISHIFTACLICTFNDYTHFRLFFKHMLLLQVLQGCLFSFLLHYIDPLSCFYLHAGYCGKC